MHTSFVSDKEEELKKLMLDLENSDESVDNGDEEGSKRKRKLPVKLADTDHSDSSAGKPKNVCPCYLIEYTLLDYHRISILIILLHVQHHSHWYRCVTCKIPIITTYYSFCILLGVNDQHATCAM